jgi:tryptophan-rich sensory protein
MIFRILLFLTLTFGGLAIGGLFTSTGVSSDWYQTLQKAPWTPPGWVFGFAWSLIMISYSLFMAAAWDKVADRHELVVLFTVQWILNVSWNPLFFYLHWVFTALVIICLLSMLIGFFIYRYWKQMKIGITALLPYFIWLLIATSLNGYIYLFN